MSKTWINTGRSLREGLRRDLPTRSQHQTIPTQPDPATKLAAIKTATNHKKHQPRKDN
jgi:hypothetical protein